MLDTEFETLEVQNTKSIPRQNISSSIEVEGRGLGNKRWELGKDVSPN